MQCDRFGQLIYSIYIGREIRGFEARDKATAPTRRQLGRLAGISGELEITLTEIFKDYQIVLLHPSVLSIGPSLPAATFCYESACLLYHA